MDRYIYIRYKKALRPTICAANPLNCLPSKLPDISSDTVRLSIAVAFAVASTVGHGKTSSSCLSTRNAGNSKANGKQQTNGDKFILAILSS